jgi:Protein kinase domain
VTILAGYQIVRKLGEGRNAEVWLGSGGETRAALKVYRLSADSARIDSEIDALARLSHRHIVRLDDLATGEDGRPILILQRLTNVSVGRLLELRRPTLGEAVTILAPVALAVAELHRSGVAHGDLRPSSILFDDAGAPVVSGFGSSVVFGAIPREPSHESLPPALLAREPAVVGDVNRLVELCRAVLGQEGAELVHWLDGESQRAAHTFPAQLADRLFSLAAGVPVILPFDVPRHAEDTLQARIEPPRNLDASAELFDSARTDSPRRSLSDSLAFLHIPEPITEMILGLIAGRSAESPSRSWRSRFTAALRPVRKPVWIMAGAVAIALVAFTAVLPAVQPAGMSSPSETASEAGHVDQQPSAAQPVDPAIIGDDPIAAGEALLGARAQCFAANSVLCLDGVDQADSSALESDSYRLRLQQAGGIVDQSFALAEAPNLLLVERLGDTALLSTGPSQESSSSPLSILVILGEDGWRIRDLGIPDAGSGQTQSGQAE